METLTMNMVQTTGFAIIVLLIGMLVRKKVRFFTKYCIPAPVIGGLIFSIVTTILRSANILEFDFDTTLQSFFQIMYFCTIGFAASFKMLKVGGSKVVKFLVIASIFALLQDVLAVGLADTVGIEPLLALMTASPALTGGMGTSAAVAPSVEALGYSAATTVAVTAATFGILCGSVMGGPVATRLIERHDLFRKFQTRTTKEDSFDLSILEDKKKFLSSKTICSGMFVILLCMGIGAYVTNGINSVVGNFVDGVSFPAYLGAMLIACIFRNVTDHSTVFGELPKEEMDALGDACVSGDCTDVSGAVGVGQFGDSHAHSASPASGIGLYFCKLYLLPPHGQGLRCGNDLLWADRFRNGVYIQCHCQYGRSLGQVRIQQNPLFRCTHCRGAVYRFYQYFYYFRIHWIPPVRDPDTA